MSGKEDDSRGDDAGLVNAGGTNNRIGSSAEDSTGLLTLRQANRMLPFVKGIVAELVELSAATDVRQRQQSTLEKLRGQWMEESDENQNTNPSLETEDVATKPITVSKPSPHSTPTNNSTPITTSFLEQGRLDEMEEVAQSLMMDQRRLEDRLNELESLGVFVHHPIDGTVDFPGRIGDQEIRWCWRPTDESVSYWHAIGESPEERRKAHF